MIDFIDIYKNMENPFNYEILYEIVKAYSKSDNIHDYIINKEKKDLSPLENYHDPLYEFLFYIWKTSIVNLSEQDIERLINYNCVQKDYLKLQEILKETPNIKSRQDYVELAINQPLINKYGWLYSKGDSPWIYIDSSLLFSWQYFSPYPVEHKLCLNCDKENIEEIVYCIIQECYSNHLPFYIKYDKTGTRDDSIVIYSNTKNLNQYINILRKVRLYNKELFSHIHDIPLLTGKIESWIGYASETKDYSKMSFSQIRANIFRFSIKNALNKWVYENKYLQIQMGDHQVYFNYYLSRCLATITINRYIKEYKELDIKDDFYKTHGIEIKEIASPEFKEKIIDIIQNNIFSMITANYNRELAKDITINTSDHHKITVTFEDFKRTLKQLAPQIFRNCPSFVEEIKKQLEYFCSKNDVDINKFCFDNKRREALFNYQRKVLSKKK